MTQREKLLELIHEFGLSGYEINDLTREEAEAALKKMEDGK